MEIEFHDVMTGEDQMVRLAMTADTESRKVGTSWMSAMQEVRYFFGSQHDKS